MLQLTFSPFPELHTPRLLLRRLTTADAADYFALRTNSQVMKYIDRKQPASVADMEAHIEKINNDIDGNRAIVWAICVGTDSKLQGTISYHSITPEHYRAELGYLLHPGQWRGGIMSEAIQAVLQFGFDKMQLHSVEAIINPENEASRRILQKFGFVQEGYFKENYYYEGRFMDSEVYSLLKPWFVQARS